jgi:hypothetical protein
MTDEVVAGVSFLLSGEASIYGETLSVGGSVVME